MPTLLVLVGPTASGKSGVAIPVARALDAEIVSIDSMLLYRGMDIGTDKPQDTGGVRHHLIDLLDPSERFDLRHYIDLADAAIADIRARGKQALVVGGTGLYLMGLLKGVFEGAPRDEEFRTRMAPQTSAVLHGRLREVDPTTADRVHPNDRRRILRALEVYETTGVPLSQLQQQFDGPDRYETRIAGIQRDRTELKRRIETRVDAMLAAGLVDEVAGLDLGPTASQAVGYKEIAGFLRGEYDLTEARRLIVSHTIRLVRRQGTWFKRFAVHWTDGSAEQILAYFGTTTE